VLLRPRRSELAIVAWGALTFAALLASFSGFRPVRDALVSCEQRLSFGSCQIGDDDLLSDIERAQFLFGRFGADFCHRFPPEEGTR